MAQDYVAPLYEGQSVEDAAEEYFFILMKRCFFQDIRKDAYGNIVSCKVHDLMHDIAQEVAGKEVHTTDDTTESLELDHKVRHLNYSHKVEGTRVFFMKTKIRTCLSVGWWRQPATLDALLSNWTCLRALDLSGSGLKSLTGTIGKLLHLRYLDLSNNFELEMLPKSITKLHNLQTLRLRNCERLKALPEGLTDLVKLRVLDLEHWRSELHCMPKGMGKLSCLQKLPMFVVGDHRNSALKQNIFDQLKDLKALTSLKGCLHVRFPINFEYAEENVREGGYIGNKEHLNTVGIMFSPGDVLVDSRKEELLLEDLQPHSNVKELILSCYKATRMPSWGREDHLTTFLPNLVKIELQNSRLQQLPLLRKLQHLKSLILEYMSDLEYVECATTNGNVHDGAGTSRLEIFFPSLKSLCLGVLPKFKGWWRENEIVDKSTRKEPQLLPTFPCLSYLTIRECPNLTCIPTCPTIEHFVTLGKLNEKLRIMNDVEFGNSKLRSAQICKAASFKSLFPVEAFGCLHKLCIYGAQDLESLLQVEEVFRMCSSSLEELSIGSCPQLKSLYGGLEHLHSLQMLNLWNLPNLDLSDCEGMEEEGDGDGGIPWHGLQQTLRHLMLQSLPKMVKLPKGIRYLTALQFLDIRHCEGLEALPESIQRLTSLKTLTIMDDSHELWKRCQDHTGGDWPNIQHIPCRHIHKLE